MGSAVVVDQDDNLTPIISTKVELDLQHILHAY